MHHVRAARGHGAAPQLHIAERVARHEAVHDRRRLVPLRLPLAVQRNWHAPVRTIAPAAPAAAHVVVVADVVTVR